METACHLQEFLWNRCRVLSLWRTNLHYEVWILDLRWIQGKSPGHSLCHTSMRDLTPESSNLNPQTWALKTPSVEEMHTKRLLCSHIFTDTLETLFTVNFIRAWSACNSISISQFKFALCLLHSQTRIFQSLSVTLTAPFLILKCTCLLFWLFILLIYRLI